MYSYAYVLIARRQLAIDMMVSMCIAIQRAAVCRSMLSIDIRYLALAHFYSKRDCLVGART